MNYEHFWSLHAWLVEIRHRRWIFILLVVVLPVFDEQIDLLLCGLNLIKHLWTLIDSLQLLYYRFTYKLKESP
jgi:hypothetical protein